jgi:hypothetical protein
MVEYCEICGDEFLLEDSVEGVCSQGCLDIKESMVEVNI